MDSDKVTTIIGTIVGAMHQIGSVGILPQTRAQWLQTGISVGFAALGYYANKKRL